MKVSELLAILELVDAEAEVMIAAPKNQDPNNHLVCPISDADVKYLDVSAEMFYDEDSESDRQETVLLFAQDAEAE